MRIVICLVGLLLPMCIASLASGVDYLTQIKPILEGKCYSCHGVLKQEGDLRLETLPLMLESGVIDPGDADTSLLIERIVAEPDDRMPPTEDGAALKPEEIALLRDWINEGAITPEEKIPVGPESHWAFQKIVRPGLPGLQSDNASESSINPIDQWLDVKRREHGLQTTPLADRSIALRRLYLDLVGLPPTAEQLRDERPWETIVDELLESPQHGERWARHWMDVWRYSDWYGLGAQLRYSQKHLWHWRDWIVDSLNQDKGYDQMVLEMLAGDELAPDDPDVVRATGFLARNYYLFNRTTWLDSTVEHTAKAFIGLTLNCAKCHDHKYDPITHVDYYRFRAIFEPHQVRLDPVAGVTNFDVDGLPRVFDDHLDAETFLHLRGDESKPDKETEITPSVPAILASFAPPITPVDLPRFAYAPGTRDYVQQAQLADAQKAIASAQSELTAARQRHDAAISNAAATHPNSQRDFAPIDEPFDQLNDERWELVGDGWELRDGMLHQTTISREGHELKLRNTPPQDFDLTCRYQVTGGSTFKSVTFRFDQSDDASYNNFVYSSAHEPGQKVQVAYTRNGKNVYPGQGGKSLKLEVGKAYQLRFAVRDRLVNVWLDDVFLIAYTLPDRRPEGQLTVSGFDATVAFDHLTLRSLPEELELKSAGNQPALTAESTEKAVALAVAKLDVAKADAERISAIVAADNLQFDANADSAASSAAVQLAAQREAEWMQAESLYEKLLHEGDEKKIKASQAKQAKAAALLKKVAAGSGTYTPLRGSRKALETPAHNFDTYAAIYPKQSTGRRLALARWIVDRNNPLTARVAVNHVWMRHFGEPLVETVFDFGLQAKRPVHAELLDYLASEFIESGWSFRHLHRLMVTSQAYQLRSSTLEADPHTLAADPTNVYYWRMNTRRMESQAVRDSLLHLAGTLDLKLGGPSIKPGPESRRRSLYFTHSAATQDKFLTMFDDADLLQCYRRSESIVPQQALALSNSELALTASQQIAERISDEDPEASFKQFVERAFFALLARSPNSEEVDHCAEFGHQIAELHSGATATELSSRMRARLVHALINHNDFISIR
ncbi:PSD1 and planctomycete cytochrome C domain-containing protein [Novipirellula sp. SH528]|uniref:PSD1 and planctomycete cytochrome C domain-containing protein n=1 Tax=Novipirellula sp. SH528 TaxID=3454466 RepID=UPI003FA061A4